MAGRTPARKSSGANTQGRLPTSPLGATPRPPLRQVYPKPPQGWFLSEYELSECHICVLSQLDCPLNLDWDLFDMSLAPLPLNRQKVLSQFLTL